MTHEKENQKESAEAPHVVAPEAGKPELHPQDLPAGPVQRGGSLLPNDLEEDVDESSDESFPASDAPSWSPSQGS